MSEAHSSARRGGAARRDALQDLTKDMERPVLVADSTRDLLGEADSELEYVDEVEVRGRDARVRVWTLATTAS